MTTTRTTKGARLITLSIRLTARLERQLGRRSKLGWERIEAVLDQLRWIEEIAEDEAAKTMRPTTTLVEGARAIAEAETAFTARSVCWQLRCSAEAAVEERQRSDAEDIALDAADWEAA